VFTLNLLPRTSSLSSTIPPPPRPTLFPYTTLFRSLGQCGQHVFRLARDEPHRTRDFASPRPVDRLLVRVHADHLRPALRQRDGGVPDSSIQIPHHRTAHVAQLLDRPAARDRTHLPVDPLERGRGESAGRARDHARGAIHGLPPANPVCAVRAP